MTSGVAPEDRSRRRRGRPKRGDARSGRDRIVAAAEEEFSQVGFEASSFRSIARRAAVDPSLVHHYFADKSELVVEVLRLPVNPVQLLAEALQGPREGLGLRVTTTLFGAWEDPIVRKRALVMVRTAMGSSPVSTVVRSFFLSLLVDRVAEVLGGGSEAKLRAGLAASRLLGAVMARYVVHVPALASLTVEDAIALVSPSIEDALSGVLPDVDTDHLGRE